MRRSVGTLNQSVPCLKYAVLVEDLSLNGTSTQHTENVWSSCMADVLGMRTDSHPKNPVKGSAKELVDHDLNL